MFHFTYCLKHLNKIIAEIEGRCTVERDGELTVELRALGEGKDVYIPAGEYEAQIKDYLNTDETEAVLEATRGAMRGVLSYDKEMAA